jgi:hypothetical protein
LLVGILQEKPVRLVQGGDCRCRGSMNLESSKDTVQTAIKEFRTLTHRSLQDSTALSSDAAYFAVKCQEAFGTL